MFYVILVSSGSTNFEKIDTSTVDGKAFSIKEVVFVLKRIKKVENPYKKDGNFLLTFFLSVIIDLINLKGGIQI